MLFNCIPFQFHSFKLFNQRISDLNLCHICMLPVLGKQEAALSYCRAYCGGEGKSWGDFIRLQASLKANCRLDKKQRRPPEWSVSRYGQFFEERFPWKACSFSQKCNAIAHQQPGGGVDCHNRAEGGATACFAACCYCGRPSNLSL